MITINKISEILKLELTYYDMIWGGSSEPKIENNLAQSIYDLLQQQKWDDAFSLFPRRTNIILFLHIQEYLNDEQYYTRLGLILNDIYMADYAKLIRKLLWAENRNHKKMKYLTDKAHWKTLSQIKDGTTVYRGCTKYKQYGWSWTIDKEHTRLFANRNEGQVCIYKGIIDKIDVIAYYEREKEIFIEPDNVQDIDIEETWYNEKPQVHCYNAVIHQAILDYLESDEKYIEIMKH